MEKIDFIQVHTDLWEKLPNPEYSEFPVLVCITYLITGPLFFFCFFLTFPLYLIQELVLLSIKIFSKLYKFPQSLTKHLFKLGE